MINRHLHRLRMKGDGTHVRLQVMNAQWRSEIRLVEVNRPLKKRSKRRRRLRWERQLEEKVLLVLLGRRDRVGVVSIVNYPRWRLFRV